MHFADEETEVCHLPKMTLIKIWTLVCNFKPVLFPWQHRSLPSRIKEREQSSHDRWVAIREVGPCQMPHRVLGFLHDNVSGFPSQRCTSVQDLEGPPGEQRKTHILSCGELLLQKCEGRQMVQDTGHAEGDEPAERFSLTFLSGNFWDWL